VVAVLVEDITNLVAVVVEGITGVVAVVVEDITEVVAVVVEVITEVVAEGEGVVKGKRGVVGGDIGGGRRERSRGGSGRGVGK
jgi:phage-related protein